MQMVPGSGCRLYASGHYLLIAKAFITYAYIVTPNGHGANSFCP